MKDISGVPANQHISSKIDSKLRFRSISDQVVAFSVTATGTKATVLGKTAVLPEAVASNTSANDLYCYLRDHLIDTRKAGKQWQVHFLGKEDRIPDHQPFPRAAVRAAVCAGEASGVGACPAQACAGAACGAVACATQATGGGACGAQASGGGTCAAEACGAAACGAQACTGAGCPAHACGANACFGDLGLLPCPAEACFAHLGIPECPFIL